MAARALVWLLALAMLGAAGVIGAYVLTDGTMEVGELLDFGSGNAAPEQRDLGPGDGVVVYPLR